MHSIKVESLAYNLSELETKLHALKNVKLNRQQIEKILLISSGIKNIVQKFENQNLKKAALDFLAQVEPVMTEKEQQINPGSGNGPSYYQYLYSALHSASARYMQKRIDNSELKALDCQLNHTLNLPAAISNLKHYSSECGNAVIDAFFHYLLVEKKIFTQCMREFYYPTYDNICTLPYDQVCKLLDQFLEMTNSEEPIVLPIVFRTSIVNLFESQHVVVVLIHNKRIEYYDPRGIESTKKFIAKRTMHDLLEHIRSRLDTEHTIWENKHVLQSSDSHLCGLFVIHFLYKRLFWEIRESQIFSKDVYFELEIFRNVLIGGLTAIARYNMIYEQ